MSDEENTELDQLLALRDEFGKLSKFIDNRLSVLEHAIEEVREGQSGIVQSISFLDEKFEEMRKKTERIEKENQELQKQNGRLEQKVNELSSQLKELDQYHRRVNLEITGVPEAQGENPEELVLKIAQHIHPGTSAKDLDVVHRLGRPSEESQRPRPFIVRFSSRRARNAIYDGRRKLKSFSAKDLGFRSSSKIYINENLISSTRELLKEANTARRSAGFKFLWTQNGRIFVRKDEKSQPLIVSSKEDFVKFK